MRADVVLVTCKCGVDRRLAWTCRNKLPSRRRKLNFVCTSCGRHSLCTVTKHVTTLYVNVITLRKIHARSLLSVWPSRQVFIWPSRLLFISPSRHFFISHSRDFFICCRTDRSVSLLQRLSTAMIAFFSRSIRLSQRLRVIENDPSRYISSNRRPVRFYTTFERDPCDIFYIDRARSLMNNGYLYPRRHSLGGAYGGSHWKKIVDHNFVDWLI